MATISKELTEAAAVNWKASWIWGGEQMSPRNEWRCFRKSFQVPAEGWSEANLSITADSRYVLYVNGERVGRGPVRCWPFEQAYDTYDIMCHLKPGQTNTVSVLVMHFGINTFYYVRGLGGLLAQLDWTAAAKSGTFSRSELELTSGSILSDETWTTHLHTGHNRRVPRMSMQQAFAEWVDARLWDDSWTMPLFDDSGWVQARAIGQAGAEPWTKLKPRDIPLLTEERIYPSRIESLQQVSVLPWTSYLDARVVMEPKSDTHGNAIVYAGYIGTTLRLSQSAKVTIGFVFTAAFLNAVCVDGSRYSKSMLRGDGQDRYLDVELEAGDHLLLIELAGSDHGRGIPMGIDCDVPFEVVSPIAANEGKYSPYIVVGPFASYEHIDHQIDPGNKTKERVIDACAGKENALSKLNETERADYESFCKVRAVGTAEELLALDCRVNPVPLSLTSPESVYVQTVWKKKAAQKPVPAIMQMTLMPSAQPMIIPFYDRDDTELIIDFGKEWSGYFEFEVEAAKGTVIDLVGVEYMRDGHVHYTHYLDNSLRYICREGRQTYTSVIRRGFRYLLVTVRKAQRPVKMYRITALQSNYPVAEVGRFQCSDARLNDIWEMSRHTTKACMEDTFVDCPAYEQTFWVGDARNEALISYYVYGAESLVRRCLDLVPGSKFQTPLYADQVPSGWSSVIPNWTFFWIIACREYVLRTGDLDFARHIWPHVQLTLEAYEKLIDERGLLCMDAWNFLDWAAIDQPRSGVVSHQNMFMVKALLHAAELAVDADEPQKSPRLRMLADKLKQAVDKQLWSEERNAYIDCIHADGKRSDKTSMQTQVVAYLCNIADDDRKAILKRYLVSPPKEFVQIGSPFMSFFYYEALEKMGNAQRIVDDIRMQYGRMLDYGATTCWETYPKTNVPNPRPSQLTRSHCHAWSAAPAYFLGTTVLGVNAAAPGWSEVTIAPQPCGLSWARGSVPLPNEGRIDVSWRVQEDGSFFIEAWVPAGVEAMVRVPDGYEGKVALHVAGE